MMTRTVSHHLFRMRLAISVFAVCVLLSIAGACLSAWQFAQAALAMDGAATDGILSTMPTMLADRGFELALGYGILVIHALAICAFLFAMTKARRLAELPAGQAGFRWSWRWTVVSCFIPILNLLRPWIGFGELDFLTRQATQPPQAAASSRRTHITVAIGALWFSFILLCLDRVQLQILGYGLTRAIQLHDHDSIVSHDRLLAFDFQLDAAVITWAGCHAFLYLHRLQRRLARLEQDHSSGLVSTYF